MKFLWVKRNIDSSLFGTTDDGRTFYLDPFANRVTEGVYSRDRRGSTEFNREPVTDPKLVQQIKEAMKQHETD